LTSRETLARSTSRVNHISGVSMTFKSTSGDSQTYADRVARHVPGLRDMHRMAGILLSERVPENGRVLVVGAGGGLEIQAFATAQTGWRFDGVDPSADMIAQAKTVLGDMASRVAFHEGYIDDAPKGLFDGATCLLTLHFLPREERLATLRAIRRRLKPNAPFIAAHHSFPQSDGQQDLWLRRNAALLISGGTAQTTAQDSIETMKTRLPALSPEEDEAVFREAGFTDTQLFYAGFTFKGWVTYNP
jgi:tRNA (cmo5U34)-methyltransferase